jgi:tRNA 2-thiouridine synthesizing protein E
MPVFKYNDKSYKVDGRGFLVNPKEWDEHFAEGLAAEMSLPEGLTKRHWRLIHFIRGTFDKMKECPLVYVACRNNELGLGDLKRLFPTGYLRGACKLAGVTYAEAHFQRYWLEHNIKLHEHDFEHKTYYVDVQGFLVNPDEWDEYFAVSKAYELKMPQYLTTEHWDIVNYLRTAHKDTGLVPTVYQTCEDNSLTIEDLERLFPDGYHRGAVKIAGLRVRVGRSSLGQPQS